MTTTTCVTCGTAQDDAQAPCPSCGAGAVRAVRTSCGTCGAAVSADAAFCPVCRTFDVRRPSPARVARTAPPAAAIAIGPPSARVVVGLAAAVCGAVAFFLPWVRLSPLGISVTGKQLVQLEPWHKVLTVWSPIAPAFLGAAILLVAAIGVVGLLNLESRMTAFAQLLLGLLLVGGTADWLSQPGVLGAAGSGLWILGVCGLVVIVTGFVRLTAYE